MADDAERLIVLLEARIRDFEKNMQKASGTADKSYGRMRKDSKSATRQMEADMVRSTTRINQALASSSAKIGAYGKAAVGGFLGGFLAGGVAGIISQIGRVANSIAQVGDEAKRAGVSIEAFQEWKFVAEQNRIGIDQMTDGLKELNLRADEFVLTGKGSAAEAFQRLGYTSGELAKKLEDPSKLLLEIIDRLGKFDKAAQIRISDELFGGSAGERFVELIDQGEEGIRATIDRAHELGVVMDDEVIQRAAELDRKFNEVASTVSTKLKTAIVEAATALQNFVTSFDCMWQKYEERRRGAEMGAYIGSLATRNPLPAPFEHDGSANTTEKTSRLPKAEWTPPKPPPGGFGGTPPRDKEAEAAKRQAEAVRKLISDLEHELDVIGKSNTEKEIANTLRRAGVDAASKEGQQITSLVTAIEAETEAHKRAQAAAEARQQAFEGLFQMAGDGLMSIADGSVKAEDAVKKLAVQIALAAAQAALMGTGPLAGFFGGGGGIMGSLFKAPPILNAGGGFAGLIGYSSGTANTGGQRGQPRGIVHGQEAVIPLPSGGKVPVQVQGGSQASGGGKTVLEVNLSSDLVGQILSEAEGQSVRISQQTTQKAFASHNKHRQKLLQSTTRPV